MGQYLLSVCTPGDGTPPSEDEMGRIMADVDAFNEQLREAGAWVFAGGLEAPDTATVVDGRGDAVVTSDGPYVESTDYLGGFWVVTAPDADAALALAARGSAACRLEVEVRAFHPEDDGS